MLERIQPRLLYGEQGIARRATGCCLQIRMFYPELDHPAFGVIRSIAKDNTDTETGPSSAVFLDSDNMVRRSPRALSISTETGSGLE